MSLILRTGIAPLEYNIAAIRRRLFLKAEQRSAISKAHLLQTVEDSLAMLQNTNSRRTAHGMAQLITMFCGEVHLKY